MAHDECARPFPNQQLDHTHESALYLISPVHLSMKVVGYVPRMLQGVDARGARSDEVGDLNGILFFVNYTKRLIAFRADSGPTPSIYSINVLTNHIFSL